MVIFRVPILLAALVAAFPACADPIGVTVDTRTTLATFSPLRAIGAGVDAEPTGTVAKIYAPASVKGMLSLGFGALTYRLSTELSVQDWHWNPAGTWSDPANQQGYWTSSATPGAPIADSFGYALPHRGFTTDMGSNDGYSMLTDGDPTTYWKSNPYLTSAYTGEDDGQHPQWIVLDLGASVPVDAIAIKWGDPYAVDYRVQYWSGKDAMKAPAKGSWQDFLLGVVPGAAGGTITTRLALSPVGARFIRVQMAKSSGTCSDAGPTDPRNCMGYAVREIGIGTLTRQGGFVDLVRHRGDDRQTPTWVSSVDPWHGAGDQATDQEQAGLDLVLGSGLARGVPAMVPVSLLYSTPDDAAAELRYLEAQHYNIGYIELGEEPDGQYITPEDYGALYLQYAAALKAVDPAITLGGPSFQGSNHDVRAWDNGSGEKSWLKRFLAYLDAHGRRGDFRFLGFEHYPNLACDTPQAFLLSEPALLANAMAFWRADGLPAGFPIFVTEANLAANGNTGAQTIDGALWYADFIGTALATGASAAYFYQYEPLQLSPADPCPGYGTYSPFIAGAGQKIKQVLAPGLAAELVTQYWAQPVDQTHALHAVTLIGDGTGTRPVTAYAVLRPDGMWSVLLVNRDLTNAHTATVSFTGAGGGPRGLASTATLARLDPSNYAWIDSGATSHASPDGPIAVSQVAGGKGAVYTLPAASVSVLSGGLSAP